MSLWPANNATGLPASAQSIENCEELSYFMSDLYQPFSICCEWVSIVTSISFSVFVGNHDTSAELTSAAWRLHQHNMNHGHACRPWLLHSFWLFCLCLTANWRITYLIAPVDNFKQFSVLFTSYNWIDSCRKTWWATLGRPSNPPQSLAAQLIRMPHWILCRKCGSRFLSRFCEPLTFSVLYYWPNSRPTIIVVQPTP